MTHATLVAHDRACWPMLRRRALVAGAQRADRAGQPPPAPAPQTPTFKVQVDYVEVDAVVTDQQGQLRPRPEEGRLPGLRGRQAADDHRRSRSSTFRSSAPIGRCSPRRRSSPTSRPTSGRSTAASTSWSSTICTRAFGRSQRVKAAARQFIERHLGANDLMAVVHTAGRDRRQPGVHQQQAAAAGGGRQDAWAASSTRRPSNKTNEYNRTRDIRQQGDPLNDPDDAERGFNARTTLDTLRRRRRLVRRRCAAAARRSCSSAKGIDYDINDIIARNGSNHHERVDGHRRDARRDRRRDPLERRIYGIDPRGLTDLGDETIEIGSFPDDTSLGVGQGSLQNELRLSQDSLRTLSEETGGFAVVNPNDFATAFDRIVERQQLVLRAGVLPADRQARRQVPQDRRPRDAARADRPRAQRLRRRRSKADAAEDDRATSRRRRSCARRSTARCRSAA